MYVYIVIVTKYICKVRLTYNCTRSTYYYIITNTPGSNRYIQFNTCIPVTYVSDRILCIHVMWCIVIINYSK